MVLELLRHGGNHPDPGIFLLLLILGRAPEAHASGIREGADGFLATVPGRELLALIRSMVRSAHFVRKLPVSQHRCAAAYRADLRHALADFGPREQTQE